MIGISVGMIDYERGIEIGIGIEIVIVIEFERIGFLIGVMVGRIGMFVIEL